MSENPWFSTKSFNIDKLQDMFEKGQIEINPNYQRSKVWKSRQKSELIDSILYSYPIGTLVVIEREEKKMELIDGQQRLDAITGYLIDKFPNLDGITFKQLSKQKQEMFKEYKVPAIMLNSSLGEDKISSTFVRLQEGVALSTAEKVYALTGNFRDAFVAAFFNVENENFFKKISDKRFRARLVAAHFLAIELKSKYDYNKFPSIDYQGLKDINHEYKKDKLPEKTIKNYNMNIQFLGEHLDDLLKKIKVRELTPVYLLVSYMRFKEKIDDDQGPMIKEFLLNLKEDLEKFSIYDEEAPKGMDEKTFGTLMKYKAYSRQGLTPESLKERLHIIKEEYSRRMHKRI